MIHEDIDALNAIDDLKAKCILDKLALDIGYDNVILVGDKKMMRWDARLAKRYGDANILCGPLFYDTFSHSEREYASTNVSENAYKDLLRQMLIESAKGHNVSIDVISKYMRRVFLKKDTTFEEILIRCDMSI